MKITLTQISLGSKMGLGLVACLLAVSPLSAATLVTNDVTFQVDMSVQLPRWSQCWPYPMLYPMRVECGGLGWRISLTNDPSASNTSLYTGVRVVVGAPGTAQQYEFSMAGCIGASEQRSSADGACRSFNLLATNGSQVLPAVLFDDLGPADVLRASAVVQFRVNMDGAVGSDGHAFNPTVDKLYVNGDFLLWHICGVSGAMSLGWAPWGAWNSSMISVCASAYRLTNGLGSLIYSGAIPINAPNAVALTYRYTINGDDNEPTGGKNHVRYVRQRSTYTLPLDTFGVPEQELSFSNLSVIRSDPEHIRIYWQGRPGVRLQSCASLADNSWQDHLETDGLSSATRPVSNSQRFFRLVKP